ncbi:MAG: hypothetical protein LUG52_06595 [Clostridia bacterium]|nr:hypothetical protein [Clostridia bacterium]
MRRRPWTETSHARATGKGQSLEGRERSSGTLAEKSTKIEGKEEADMCEFTKN